MSDMTAPMGKAPAGWYVDGKNPGAKRYWDGTGWTEETILIRPNTTWKPAPLPRGDRPGGIIVGALLLAFGLGLVAGGIYLLNDTVGLVALIVVSVFTNALLAIGVIAKGVELGIRAARHRPGLDF